MWVRGRMGDLGRVWRTGIMLLQQDYLWGCIMMAIRVSGGSQERRV